MPNTYTLIASNTVGSGGAATVTFSSIPSTYTDLLLKASARSSSSTGYFTIEFNGSSSGYTSRDIYGTGSAAGSQTDTIASARSNPSTYTASTFASSDIYIPNYAGSNYKSLSVDTVQENNATAVTTEMLANLWSNTAAITSIVLAQVSGSFVQYSTFYLYGISKT